MKKIFKFLVWLLAVAVILVVALYLTAGFWVKTAVSTLVPQVTKTAASLDDADISLLKGELTLKGFRIANPDGFVGKNAFELGEVFVKFAPSSLLTQQIDINEIRINGTKVDMEASKTGRINLIAIAQNAQEFMAGISSSEQEKTAEPQTNETKSDKTVLIKDLSIINTTADFAFMNNKTQFKVPDYHEKNIGTDKKMTLQETVALILSKLSGNSFTEYAKQGKDSVNKIFDDLAKRTKEAEPVRDLIKKISGGLS